MPSALKTLIVETHSDNILQDYHNSKYAVAPFPLAYVTSTWEPPIEPTKAVTFSYSPIQFQIELWPENHIYYHPTIGQKIYTNVIHDPKIKPTEPTVAPTKLETTTLPLTESQSVAFLVEDVGSRKFSQSNSRSFQISYEIVIFFLCFII